MCDTISDRAQAQGMTEAELEELLKMTELLGFVCDTNVYISSLLSNQSTTPQAFQLALARSVPIFSVATFNELQTALYSPATTIC